MPWRFAIKSKQPVEIPEISDSPSVRFAFRLFRELAGQQKAENVFFSPASVMLCLGMLLRGATGQTQEAIAKVLEVADLKPQELRTVIVALKSALRIEAADLLLQAGNSLWCNQQWPPCDEYLAGVREDYDAEVNILDFRQAEAVTRINSWVLKKTRGKIGSIVDWLDPLSSLVAINAIYFKDSWSKQFDPALTLEDSFHTSHGRVLKVPFMSQHGSYAYDGSSKIQIVRLPYKTQRLAMYVCLPSKRSSLQEFRQDLNSAAWENWMRRLETTAGHIRLPRFKLTYQSPLNSALSKLGMGVAFDPQRARFDRIHPPPPGIWIDTVLHRALVEVNEEGTEAAAVTAVVFLESALWHSRPVRTFEMIVDRPFFFAVRDHLTNTILFMGSVEESVC